MRTTRRRRVPRRWFSIAATICLVAGMLAVTGGFAAAGGTGDATTSTPLAPARAARVTPSESRLIDKAAARGSVRVLVTMRGQATKRSVLGELSLADATVLTVYHAFPVLLVDAGAAALRGLANDARVIGIQEDRAQPAALASSVPAINADDLHLEGFDGSGTVVAILDTGIDWNHPFFAGRIVSQACYSNAAGKGGGVSLCPNGTNAQTTGNAADAETTTCLNGTTNICTHGSHVAGIAAGNATASTPGAPGDGVAPDARIIAIQVFTRMNSGTCGTTPAPCVTSYNSDQLLGLQRVIDLENGGTLLPRHIVSANMSIGGGQYSAACDTDSRKAAVDALKGLNIATVIAAGNDGYTNSVSAPGCISTAVTVGATDDVVSVASFSNRGSLVDLFAPGVAIDSSIPNDTYESEQGTSMAAPHVAGAWAVLREAFPSESVDQIQARLQDNGVNIAGQTARRIDLLAAARPAKDPLAFQGRGPMQVDPRVYIDYWGWGTDPVGEKAVLEGFLNHVGNTGWLATLGQYGAGNPANLLRGQFASSRPIPALYETGSTGVAKVKAEADAFAAQLGLPTSAQRNVQIIVALPPGHNPYADPAKGTTTACGSRWRTAGGWSGSLLPYAGDTEVAACAEGLATKNAAVLTTARLLAATMTDPVPNKGWRDNGANAPGSYRDVATKCRGAGNLLLVLNGEGYFVPPLWSNLQMDADGNNGCSYGISFDPTKVAYRGANGQLCVQPSIGCTGLGITPFSSPASTFLRNIYPAAPPYQVAFAANGTTYPYAYGNCPAIPSECTTGQLWPGGTYRGTHPAICGTEILGAYHVFLQYQDGKSLVHLYLNPNVPSSNYTEVIATNMATGTSPSVDCQSGGGGTTYVVAYANSNNNLQYCNAPNNCWSVALGVYPGTSPAITGTRPDNVDPWRIAFHAMGCGPGQGTGSCLAVYTPAGGLHWLTAEGVHFGAPVSAQQTISTTGSPTGGTFTLTASTYLSPPNSTTTDPIAYNASAAAIQAALQARSSIGAGNISCTGGPLPAGVVCTFTGALANRPQQRLQAVSSLSGGTNPKVVVTTNKIGAAPGSPAVCGLATTSGGDWIYAIRGLKNQLTTVGFSKKTGGLLNWGALGAPAMDPGSDPAITCMANGGYQVAIQANTGKLWTMGSTPVSGGTETMSRFTSPTVAHPQG